MFSKRHKLSDTGLVYGEGTERLSQLSDIVSLSQDAEAPSQPTDAEAPIREERPGFADFQESLPSQPLLLPTPELPPSDQRLDGSGARDLERQRTRFAPECEARAPGALHSTESMAGADYLEAKRRVTRRGPMDEMRQLVRILVKIIPHSARNIKACEEGGGGNRISEEQIKSFLASTLGDAPQPRWGVPEGWGNYLASLFTWVTDTHITKEEAMRCAKREPGRSWEAIDSELATLGLLPATWPLPLSKESMGSALVPTSQDLTHPRLPAPKAISPKRPFEKAAVESQEKRPRLLNPASSRLLEREEVTLWSEALQLILAANSKSGMRASSIEVQMAIAKLKAEIQSAIQVPGSTQQAGPMPFFIASQAPQIVPVPIAGPNGQFQTAYTLQLASASSTSSALEPSASLDLGGMHPSQFLLSQPGVGASSAFQAVKPGCPDRPNPRERSSPVLDVPPPLRLSPSSPEPAPSSPGTDEEDNSAVFNPSQLSSPGGGLASKLFKPTALKSAFLERAASQGEARSPPASSSPCHESHTGGTSAGLPVLGYVSNGHFVPLSGASALHSLAAPQTAYFQGQHPMLAPTSLARPMPTQPTLLSSALEASRLQQANPWVPNLTAALQ